MDDEKARVVLATLGAPIQRYAINGVMNWAEVERLYGSRFKGASLYHDEGEYEYDDEGYYYAGEVYAIVASDVTNPEETIKNCLLQEIRLGRDELDRRNSSLPEMESTFTIGHYAEHCNDTLLWQHGIVFAYRVTELDTIKFGDPTLLMGENEQEELEKFLCGEE